ncbi:MAG: hypothetical protein U0841_14545 [Chloroflexia bacterium]
MRATLFSSLGGCFTGPYYTLCAGPDEGGARHDLGVVAFQDALWVVAGDPKPGLTVSNAVEVWKP